MRIGLNSLRPKVFFFSSIAQVLSLIFIFRQYSYKLYAVTNGKQCIAGLFAKKFPSEAARKTCPNPIGSIDRKQRHTKKSAG